ncbi:MAG: TRAP transporter large permease, partial [Alphaproteobacteria bacterium]
WPEERERGEWDKPMSPIAIGLVGIVVLLGLLAIRMPVGVALIVVGLVGFASVAGWDAALGLLGASPFEHSFNYELSVIPLFVLMGNFAMVSGMSGDAYAAGQRWVGHWRGGLASATIVACSVFAAVSGSSVASAATMGAVALPEMRRRGYSARLATGCIAAGGTLGILIPPSTGFVVYAIITEESIGRLFLAGFFPGLLLTALFILTIGILTRFRPDMGPSVPRATLAERIGALRQVSALVTMIVITLGGIYIGVFTPTEAAAIGALFSIVLAFWRRRVTRGNFIDALLQTARTTSFVFLILIGAHLFSPFLAVAQIATTISNFIEGVDASPDMVLLMLLVLFIILGTFLEGFAMLVLTLPIVYPVITDLGFDPIWFGVVMVIVLEMGLISPPVGINVFVVKGIAGDVPMKEIFIGILPFWAAMLVCLVMLVVFPEIALFLPNSMIQ